MNYNVFVRHDVGGLNLLDIFSEKLQLVIEAYKKGKPAVTISGVTYRWGSHIHEIRIFENPSSYTSYGIHSESQKRGGYKRVFGAAEPLVSPDFLAKLGTEVTDDFLHDTEFGCEYIPRAEARADIPGDFVALGRINELKRLGSNIYDLSRLIELCEALNTNWKKEHYFVVGMVMRAIINHIPPIFDKDFTTFDQVIGQYGDQSFKRTMRTLNGTLRNIADSYAHKLIRKKDPLPNLQQVDFRPQLDVLLSEIVAILHK